MGRGLWWSISSKIPRIHPASWALYRQDHARVFLIPHDIGRESLYKTRVENHYDVMLFVNQLLNTSYGASNLSEEVVYAGVAMPFLLVRCIKRGSFPIL